MLRPGFRVFDLVSVSFEFRFCACVLCCFQIFYKTFQHADFETAAFMRELQPTDSPRASAEWLQLAAALSRLHFTTQGPAPRPTR